MKGFTKDFFGSIRGEYVSKTFLGKIVANELPRNHAAGGRPMWTATFRPIKSAPSVPQQDRPEEFAQQLRRTHCVETPLLVTGLRLSCHDRDAFGPVASIWTLM